MITDEFLRILRCPLTRGTLALADPHLLNGLNAQVGAGKLLNRGGAVVDRALECGLVNEAETVVYPVHNDVPCLLIDEAIPLDQLGELPSDG